MSRIDKDEIRHRLQKWLDKQPKQPDKNNEHQSNQFHVDKQIRSKKTEEESFEETNPGYNHRRPQISSTTSSVDQRQSLKRSTLPVEGQTLKKPRQDEDNSLSLLAENQSQSGYGETDSIQGHFVPIQITPNTFKDGNEIMFFENESLKLAIQKCKHNQVTKFSHLDSLFQVKIIPKSNKKNPLYFKDLLDILDKSLKYVMNDLQGFFPENPNALCFLTIYQDGMVNGLSTGAYLLSDESGALVNKLMEILFNFLMSDENLTVNNGFKVYVDVYSKEHGQKVKKIYKGRQAHSTCSGKHYWSLQLSLDQLQTHPFLNDKCLLIAIALGHLQNLFFEHKKPLPGKGSFENRFIYAQGIGYSHPSKQRHGLKIIEDEVKAFYDYLKERKVPDYTDLDLVAPIAYDAYSCQVVVFSGLNNEIKYMFPKTFDETLRPIYLFDPQDGLNHIIFIKYIKAFFRAMNKVACVYCKKSYKNLRMKHRCTVRRTCLACRRYFSRPHAIPSKIHAEDYCYGDMTLNKFVKECDVCNLKLLTQSCALFHKRLCGKKGNLGYKCKSCKKFYSRNKKFPTAEQFEKEHVCGQKLCPTCKVYFFENDHICELKKFYFGTDTRSLAFLTMEFLYELNTCTTPNLITILKERSPFSGVFDYYQISDFDEEVEKEEKIYNFSYTEQEFAQNFPLKLSKEFKYKIAEIQGSMSKTCSEKLMKLITSWPETIIVCRDEVGYVYDALIKAILRANINLKILTRGKKYFSVEILELKIKIINIVNYLPGNEIEISKLSGITCPPKFFPHKFNLKENYSFQGQIPEFKYFESMFECKELLEQKLNYHENFSEIWNFKKEIKLFSRQKLYLLCASTCLFLKELLLLQENIQLNVNPANLNKNKILWPFSNNICTFSGFIYGLFRGLFLNEENIFSIQNEYYVPSRKVSQAEYEFCKYLEFKFPELELIHNYSNKNGQKFFKDCVPDIYIPSLKYAIFFNGCYFHGHFRDSLEPTLLTDTSHSVAINEILDDCPDQKDCRFSKAAKSASINKKLNKSYEILQNEFHSKVASLKRNNPDEIKNVKVFWECYYRKEICKTSVHKSFKKSFKKHPLRRLTPRDCSVGGFLQNFAYLWNQLEFPNETFFCCDINGLYSHAAITQCYNVGKYITIIGAQLKNVKIIDNNFYYFQQKMFGTALVTVLAPKSLFCPFLVFKENKKSILTLCRQCYLKSRKKCNHSESQREFCGSYFIEELEFALLLGYKVTAIHECHAYFEQKPIFGNFLSVLNYNKIKYSDYLSTKTENEKDLYCHYLNKKMNFTDPFLLKPEDKSDPFRKHLFKMAANSLFGKLQQRKDKIITNTLTDDDDLNTFIWGNKNEVQSIQCFEDLICQVSIKPKPSEIKDSLETNCYLGAQIVANARIYFYKEIQKVIESKAKLFYVDTDSIFFSLPKNKRNPLEISDATGDFKHVYENVSNFYCLGPKNYIISFIENGQLKISTKVRGVNLNAPSVENILEPNTYRDYLLSFLKKETKTLKIPQSRTRCLKKKPFSRQTKLEVVTFSNKINSCRYFKKKSSILTTLPYGFE